MAESTKPKKPSIWSRLRKYFKDCRSEFKKLVWPTPKQLLKNSTVVLGGIIIVGALLTVIDYGLNQGLFALKDLIDFIRPVS